jgi:hypothetical protein
LTQRGAARFSRSSYDAVPSKVITAVLACFIIAAAPPPIVVDGSPLPASASTQLHGISYVTLRALGDALGATASYDGRLREAVLTTEFREVVMPIGQPVLFVNGARRASVPPAILQDGKVLVPLRAAVAAAGAVIRYDSAAHAIDISTAGVASAPYPRVTAPPVPSTNTLEGTVTEVRASMVPPAVAVSVDQLSYTITVPEGTQIQFRDTRGGSTGSGPLSQVRPGDTLIATLDASGHVISMADIFTGYAGTIAAVSGQNMVLTNGRVVESAAGQTAVTLDGRSATFAQLSAGDLVTVRADPRTGKVRDVVALTPGGLKTTATATPSTGGSASAVSISNVTDDATHAFRVGQTLHVTVDGTAGASATFDLSNVIVDNPMHETQPGHYEGAYLVEVGTNLVDAPIIVRLEKDGVTAQAEGPDPLAIITSPPSVLDAKPDSESAVNNPRPNVYVTFSTFGDRGMDAQSLKLVIDGKDVTAAATKTAEFISYYPSADLQPGAITVEVSGADTAGNRLSYRWTFQVVRAQQ